jgi:hypothetical protein
MGKSEDFGVTSKKNYVTPGNYIVDAANVIQLAMATIC